MGRLRALLALSAAATFAVAIAAEYELSATCLDPGLSPMLLGVAFVSPLVAVAVLSFRPRSIWLALLALAPVAGFVVWGYASISGGTAGACY